MTHELLNGVRHKLDVLSIRSKAQQINMTHGIRLLKLIRHDQDASYFQISQKGQRLEKQIPSFPRWNQTLKFV